MEHKIDRRDFLKYSLGAALTSALLVSGCKLEKKPANISQALRTKENITDYKIALKIGKENRIFFASKVWEKEGYVTFGRYEGIEPSDAFTYDKKGNITGPITFVQFAYHPESIKTGLVGVDIKKDPFKVKFIPKTLIINETAEIDDPPINSLNPLFQKNYQERPRMFPGLYTVFTKHSDGEISYKKYSENYSRIPEPFIKDPQTLLLKDYWELAGDDNMITGLRKTALEILIGKEIGQTGSVPVAWLFEGYSFNP
jgi:hypothetical protein